MYGCLERIEIACIQAFDETSSDVVASLGSVQSAGRHSEREFMVAMDITKNGAVSGCRAF